MVTVFLIPHARAEPRNPERYTAKLRRRSYSYSLGLTETGTLDMGLVFVSFQQNLKTGFIDTQKRLNGEPLERYIKPLVEGTILYYLESNRHKTHLLKNVYSKTN